MRGRKVIRQFPVGLETTTMGRGSQSFYPDYIPDGHFFLSRGYRRIVKPVPNVKHFTFPAVFGLNEVKYFVHLLLAVGTRFRGFMPQSAGGGLHLPECASGADHRDRHAAPGGARGFQYCYDKSTIDYWNRMANTRNSRRAFRYGDGHEVVVRRPLPVE